MAVTKQALDKILGKVVSRKLLALMMATGLFWVDKLTSDQWIMMAIAYVGVQGVTDIAMRWKNNGLAE